MAKIREETDVKPWKPRGTDRRTRVLMAEYVDSGFLIGRETSRLISASPTCFRFAKIVSARVERKHVFWIGEGDHHCARRTNAPSHLPHAPSPTCSAPPPSSPSSSRSSRARRLPCPRTSLALNYAAATYCDARPSNAVRPRPPPLAAPCALLLRMISPRRARGTVRWNLQLEQRG